jgi:mono/diheme cytochrome c family protein
LEQFFMASKVLLLAMAISAGLLQMATGQNAPPASKKWEAPPEAAAKSNPEAKNPAAPGIGRRSFMHLCVNCHGEDGSGESPSAADLRSAGVQSQSDGALFWKITNGNTNNGMPSFAALPETERWDIVSFLRTLKP